MEEMSTRLPGTVSSDLDLMYAIPDPTRGMLLEHWLMVQSVGKMVQRLNDTYSGLQRKSPM